MRRLAKIRNRGQKSTTVAFAEAITFELDAGSRNEITRSKSLREERLTMIFRNNLPTAVLPFGGKPIRKFRLTEQGPVFDIYSVHSSTLFLQTNIFNYCRLIKYWSHWRDSISLDCRRGACIRSHEKNIVNGCFIYTTDRNRQGWNVLQKYVNYFQILHHMSIGRLLDTLYRIITFVRFPISVCWWVVPCRGVGSIID